MFDFFSPSWRFQIQQDSNQQIVLSQWVQGQGQRPQDGQIEPAQQQLANPDDIAVNISGSDGPVLNQQSQPNDHTNPAASSSQAANVPNNPLSAINLFLEQNPEMYGVLQTLLAYIPFVILVILKEIYKHTSGKRN